MQRPDLDTLAGVNAECQLFGPAGAHTLVIRKVSGHDRLRLLRCRTGGEECSERRGPALFNTQLPEAQAASVINHLGEGCGVRATARLVHVAKDTGARLLRMVGRHAERFHDHRVHDLTPQALEFDAQWSVVKKRSSLVGWRSALRQGTCGPIRRWLPIATCSCRSWSVNGPKSRRGPWGTMPRGVSVRGICQRALPMPMRATRRPSWPPWDIAILRPARATEAAQRGHSCAGHKDGRMGRCKNSLQGGGSSGATCGSCMAQRA
jgi:hypothetical protein